MRALITSKSALVAILVALLCLPAAPLAHVERPSYWPDPAPDASVKPAAGGKVPKIRSLASALDRKRPGDTRVVCQQGSLKALRASVARAVKQGYYIRPSDHRSFSRTAGKRLIGIKTKVFKTSAAPQ